VERLLRHVGRVFDMAIRVVHTADPLSRPARVEPPPSSDVLAMFDDRLATMLHGLATTDPATPAGTPAWHPGPTAPMTAAYWSRRMAHEVTGTGLTRRPRLAPIRRWMRTSPPMGWTRR
jgi:hypothetical protein